jgi:hypothetical protein
MPCDVIRENIHVLDIVRTSLVNRAASYPVALEHLVIMTPQVQAVDAERLLNQLQFQISRYDTLVLRRPADAATCADVAARAVVAADAGAQAAVSSILKQPQYFLQSASDQAREPRRGLRSARSRSATLQSTDRLQ